MPSAKIQNTTPFTTYSMTVQARNAIGWGPESPPVEAQFNYNKAYGGDEPDGVEIANYDGTDETWTVHTFTAPGTLDVSIAANPFRVFLVGAGGGGTGGMQGRHGDGGNGGATVLVDDATLPVGLLDVVRGQGGSNTSSGHPAGNGTASTIATYSAAGGRGGQYHDSKGGSAGPNSGYYDVDGDNLIYGQGGRGPDGNGYGQARRQFSGGGGGAGSDWEWEKNGSNGSHGIVIIAYRTG